MQVTVTATIDVTPVNDTLQALSALVGQRLPQAGVTEVDGKLVLSLDLGTVEV